MVRSDVRACLITNPKSGRGHTDLSEAITVLQAHGWEVVVRQNGQTATLSATTDGGGYTPVARRLTLRFHGPAIRAAHLDGDAGSPLAVTPATAGPETVHVVELPTDPAAWTLTIEHAHPNG